MCLFSIADGWAACVNCGRSVPTAETDPGRVHRACVGDAPCIHRGAQLREQPGTLCGLREMVFPVFACSVFGECTTARVCRKSEVKASCATCEERA